MVPPTKEAPRKQSPSGHQPLRPREVRRRELTSDTRARPQSSPSRRSTFLPFLFPARGLLCPPAKA
jgi:hypothetical protein